MFFTFLHFRVTPEAKGSGISPSLYFDPELTSDFKIQRNQSQNSQKTKSHAKRKN